MSLAQEMVPGRSPMDMCHLPHSPVSGLTQYISLLTAAMVIWCPHTHPPDPEFFNGKAYNPAPSAGTYSRKTEDRSASNFRTQDLELASLCKCWDSQEKKKIRINSFWV